MRIMHSVMIRFSALLTVLIFSLSSRSLQLNAQEAGRKVMLAQLASRNPLDETYTPQNPHYLKDLSKYRYHAWTEHDEDGYYPVYHWYKKSVNSDGGITYALKMSVQAGHLDDVVAELSTDAKDRFFSELENGTLLGGLSERGREHLPFAQRFKLFPFDNHDHFDPEVDNNLDSEPADSQPPFTPQPVPRSTPRSTPSPTPKPSPKPTPPPTPTPRPSVTPDAKKSAVFSPTPAPTPEYPTAKASGKPDLVISPYDKNGYVDVSGFKAGDLVRDPYSNKIFRVPPMTTN